jgi:hypothetical protein
MSDKSYKYENPEGVIDELMGPIYGRESGPLSYFFLFAADQQPPQRMALLMLLAAEVADKIRYSESGGLGTFASKGSFASKYRFRFKLTHADYARARLDEWFLPTAGDSGWLSDQGVDAEHGRLLPYSRW